MSAFHHRHASDRAANSVSAIERASSTERVPATIILQVLCCSLLLWETAGAQDMSWVKGTLERSRQTVRDSLPAWQYDPRVAAGAADASLNDLSIVNPDRLWAVGDRGLILTSSDGGRSWQMQSSGTSLNLYGVAFVDERRGVVVGGGIQPMSQTSVGIILVTSDAGQTWQVISSVSRAALPRLTGISYQPGGPMRAWGDYSSSHLTAIFESVDQGQSWLPLPCTLGHVQSTASQKHGLQLAIDRAGRLAQLPANLNRPATQLATPTTPVLALGHTGTQWLAVGTAGTVTTSRDALQWHDQPLPLSARARSVCEFRCMCVHGADVWIGGSPGSLVMHSPDGGQSWRAVATGQAWPIQAIKFFDSQRGWLVTEAGTVLATRDGGNNWWPQRLPVQRAGLQVISLSDQHIPWPALAEATWQAEQATSLLVLHRQRCEDAVDFAPDAPATIGAAGVQTGLTSSCLVPYWPLTDVSYAGQWHALYLPQSGGQLHTPWSGVPSMLDQVTLTLRMRRPTVVLVSAGEQNSAQPHPMTRMVTRTLELAAQESVESQWLSGELHLPSWRVTKLLSVVPSERSDFTVTSDQLLKDSGLAVQDVLSPVDGLGGVRIANTGMRCLLLGSGHALASQSLFSSGERRSEASREVELSKIGNLQLLMGRVHRQRAWQALAPSALNLEEPLESWLKKVEAVLEMTPKAEAGMDLRELSQACWQAGQWQRWSAVVARATQHTSLTDAARWHSLCLMRLVASDERLAWERSQTTESSPAFPADPLLARSGKPLASPIESDPFELREPSAGAGSSAGNTAGNTTMRISDQTPSAGAGGAPAVNLVQPDSPIQLVSAEHLVNATDHQKMTQLASAVAEFNRLMERDRSLAARPDLVLAQFARRRALAELAGQPAPDVSSLKTLSESAQLAGWQQMAQQELALVSGRATANLWTARAARTPERPLLDGHADEACWRGAQSIQLSNPFQDEQPSAMKASIKFAYDSEFLYVLIDAAGEPDSLPKDQTSSLPRRRDMDLSGSDHVLVSLDTDRDYVSASELAVNRHGHTFDRCCNWPMWNPRRWYVAVAQQADGWTAEYAVQLSDLTSLSVGPGRVWGLSAFRYLPDGQVASWSQLRSYHPRLQGNGLLLFE